MFCASCGSQNDDNAQVCVICGQKLSGGTGMAAAANYQQPLPPQPYQQPGYAPNPYMQQPYVFMQPNGPAPGGGYVYNGTIYPDINPLWPRKSKMTAGILGLLLGGLGIHKFYMGHIGMGVLYLLFCWTCVPEIAGFIEGIIYLCQSDHEFMIKNKVTCE